MLVLTSDGDGFPDDVDPTVRYHLPTEVVPVRRDGRPDVSLLTDADGGVLALRLTTRSDRERTDGRRAPLAGGRFRVVTRGATGTSATAWADAHCQGDVLVDRRIRLDAADAAVLRAALSSDGAAVDVELALDVRGRTPSWPWLVEADGPALGALLGALLGPDPVAWVDVVDAVGGIGDDVWSWHPVEPGPTPRPAGNDLALALAGAARGAVVERVGDGWSVRAALPDTVSLSLAVPSVAARTVRLGWSFSSFLAAVADPTDHVADLTAHRPLAATDLHVVNEVPLDPDGIRRVDVAVSTGGPTGDLSCSFTIGGPDAVRLRFARVAGRDTSLRWSARTTIAVDGRPVVLSTDPVPTGLLLRITPADLGLSPVRVHVEDAVVAALERVEVSLGRATVSLDGARRVTWVVGRQAPPTASATAIDTDGTRTDLGVLPVVDGAVAVTATLVGVGDQAAMALGPADWATIAYLAVQVEGSSWTTVPHGTTHEHPVQLRHRGAPPALRLRTRSVARSPDGTTATMVESAWRDVAGSVVSVVG